MLAGENHSAFFSPGWDPNPVTPPRDNGHVAHPTLPSLRTERGSPTPIGFVAEPDSYHVGASSDALGEIALISQSTRLPEGKPLRVNFCPHRYNHLLSPQLFGFVVHHFDSAGERVDALEHDLPIRYSINLNAPVEPEQEPVEPEQETALLFLAELVLRQQGVRPESDNFDIATLHDHVTSLDSQAYSTVVDALRFGWKNALKTVVSMANASGWDLVMSYQGDPLPTREDVVSRHGVLKDAYNSIDEVRLLVDRFVSFFGRQDRFRVAGASDPHRAYLQGSSGVMHTSEYLSHLTRDAEVLGNGFATFHTTPSPAMSLQDPSSVEVTAEASFWKIESSSSRVPIVDHTLHLRGIAQMNSEYGISMLEPLVASYEILRTTLRAREESLVCVRP